jgi:hypothetical protein
VRHLDSSTQIFTPIAGDNSLQLRTVSFDFVTPTSGPQGFFVSGCSGSFTVSQRKGIEDDKKRNADREAGNRNDCSSSLIIKFFRNVM